MKNIDVQDVYVLFEEIKESIKKNKDNPQQEIKLPDLSGINDLAGKLESAIEATREPVKTEHRHIIDFGSCKVLLAMLVMLIVMLGLSFVVRSQRQTISSYRDNDLKYRYIKMYGEATPETMLRLEECFTYRRNTDSIATIRKQVKQYERLVKEQAEKAERAKLNALEAERLEKEAETLKGKK